MRIYTNISNFMRKEGLSYSDRVVLHVMNAVIKKGFQVIPFIYENSTCIEVSSQLFAEYFFTKNILLKDKYKGDTLFALQNINEDDVYFEVDALGREKYDWDEYYSKLEATKCSMYSYVYFGISSYTDSRWIEKMCCYMDKVYVETEEMKNELFFKREKGVIEVLDLHNFIEANCKDSFLKIEKGLEQVIKEGNFIVCLFDPANLRSNRIRLEEIQQKYPQKTVVFISGSKDEMKALNNYIYKNKELGKRLFLAIGMDYYTLLNLYAKADMVIVPMHCESCKFEIMQIAHVNGQCQFF